MRCYSVKCLGTMGMSSDEACLKHRKVLFQVCAQELEYIDVRIEAVKSLVDIATIYPSHFLNHTAFGNILLRIQDDATNDNTTAGTYVCLDF